jgi:N-acetylneuraminic acid mutarotase
MKRSFPFLISGLALSCVLAASSGSWQILTPENTCTARHETSAAAVNGVLYLLGGRGKMNVEAYDPRSNRWTKKAMVPEQLHHFAALTVGDRIAVLGALTGGYPKETPVSHLWWYEPKTDVWTNGQEVPVARRRGAAGCVQIGDELVLVGGNTNGHWNGCVPWVDALNLKTGEWRQLPDMPHARDHFQAGFVEGKIVCAGGRKTHAETKQVFNLTVPHVDVFDWEEGTWRTLPQPIPTQRAGAPTVTHEGQVIVMGGESNRPLAHDEVEAFSIASGEWSSLPKMTQGRHSGGGALIGSDVYFVAGCIKRGGGSDQSTVEKMSLSPKP